MSNNNLLTLLGYSNNENTVYQSLLQSGPANISAISKNTGIYRPAIYRLLPHLINDGLISRVVHGKITHYTAESPQRLTEKIADKKMSLEQDFQAMLKISAKQPEQPIIKYLKGKQGIRSVFDDVVDSLNNHDVYYRYSSRRDTTDGNQYLSAHYYAERTRKQIERFVISGQKINRQKKPRLERAVKEIPANLDLFEYDINLIIYANKVAVIDYNSETAFIVENTMFAEFQKKLFLILYHKLQ